MDLLSGIKNKFSASRESHFLALEIGSRSIKALIIKISDQKGYIIGAGTQDLLFEQTEQGQIRHIQSVAVSADIAIEKALQLAGVRPKYAVVNAVSPEQINEIQRIVYHREKPKSKISGEELTRIFSHINLELSQKFKRDHEGYETLSAIILDTKIDNITVKNPLDFTGQELSFLVYQSYLPLLQLSAFQSVIDELKINSSGFVSQPYAMFKAFDPQSFHYKNSLFLDVGGALTEIILCQDGQLKLVTGLNIGGDYFTVKLAENLNVSRDKAEQYKKDYVAGLLTSETETDLHNLFTEISAEWLAGVEECLANLPDRFDPSKLYLSGGGIMLSELTDAIAASPLFGSVITTRIHAVDIDKIIDKTGLVNPPYFISPITLANTGLSCNQNNQLTTNLYQKFIQTLRT